MRKTKLYLKDILGAIESIGEFTHGMSLEEFMEDDKTKSAVIQKFEIIGEAAKNIPDEFRTQHKEIPWKKMAGMRDRLVHAYFKIDEHLVWQTIQRELPDLSSDINSVLENLK